MIDDSGTYLQPQQSGLAAATAAAASLMRARGRERVTVSETSSAAVSKDERRRAWERPRSRAGGSSRRFPVVRVPERVTGREPTPSGLC